VRVGVIGSGYVGLTTAACLSHLGHDVVAADLSPERVERLNRGDVPILEEGLPRLVTEGLSSRRLRFVVGATNAARDVELVFICVATPQGEDGAADMSFVEAAAREIAPVLAPGTVVINKSTMPVGSTRFVQRVLHEAAGGQLDRVTVASNPEFLREGQAVRDFLNPDRIVVGCDDPEAAVKVTDLYRSMRAPVIVTDAASAEMIKYASNAFLATKISFINAIANLCEAVDADVREVALGMGYDPRIGFQFLHPGPGYGGSCFPKDTSALLYIARSHGYDFDLLQGVIDVNRRQYERTVDKVRHAVGGSFDGAAIGAWGLTFKADTDDVRDSPALHILGRVIAEGGTARAYDPAIGAGSIDCLPGLEVCADPYDVARDADVLVVLTEWDEFRWKDFDRVLDVMRKPRIVDARNLLDPAALRRRGFTYVGVGR
jgi:UDPglucose 6-dehydrogenase